MPKLTPKRVLTLVVCLSAVTSLLPSRYCGYARYFAMTQAWLVAPLSHPLSMLTGSTRGGDFRPPSFQPDMDLVETLLMKDNEITRLRKELDGLRLKNQQLEGIIQELGPTYQFRLADVVAREVDDARPWLTLNRGNYHSVREGLAVIHRESLIGEVVQVGELTSQVRPITATGVHITAVITAAVLADGQIPPERLRLCQFVAKGKAQLVAEVEKSMAVDVGEVARLYDRVWPRGVQGWILGKVTEVRPNEDDLLRKFIVVQPIRSVEYCENVTVVIPQADEQVAPEEPQEPGDAS